MRALFSIAALSLLAACATTDASPAPIIYEPCTALTMQPVLPQPRLPDGATVPAPTTPEDAEGLRQFLEHAAIIAAWGREGWARVEAQQKACE